jgi:hypothetical protein
MDKLQQSMDNLYYKFIEIHANKNKIKINPKVTLTESIDIEPDTNTETETKYSDEYIYRKPWNKLNTIHKIIKIKEFVSTLSIDDIELKKNLKKNLVDMIKTKKLTKKNDINYDAVNGIIISIPILQYKDNKYIIS